MEKLFKKLVLITAIIVISLLFFGSDSWSQQDSLKNPKILIVGTKEAPPFSIKNSDGSWQGISIDLFKEIASRQKILYEFKEFNLKDLLEAVKTNKIDVAVAALTITPEREKYLDFSHPFYSEGLGIAVPKANKGNWFIVIKRFISFQFLSVIGVLALILLIFGYLAWLFERKKNSEEFDNNIVKGLGDGFWWSAVTMTTVGYGDKSPRTLAGRFVALIWMFTSVIIISSFTAAITSAVTVNRLEGSINGPSDLAKARVATVSQSASAQILEERGINCQYFENLKDALTELTSGTVDAVVYDFPLLKYIINRDFKSSLRVLPNTFIDQPYGFAFPSESSIRETVNQSLLEVLNSNKWQEILDMYLGSK